MLSNECEEICRTHKENSNMIGETMEVSSMCMQCEKEGMNKLVRIDIPYFKDVLVHSFECNHCHYKNNIIQDLNQIKEKGIRIKFELRKEEDFSRQLIKSDYAIFKIPEINFEIPAETQRGCVNTIEGFLQTSIESLSEYLKNLKSMCDESLQGTVSQGEDHIDIQNMTKIQYDKDGKTDPTVQITVDNYIKMIEITIFNLSEYLTRNKFPLLIEIEDPSGLSCLEYYDKDLKNNCVHVEHYDRTIEELNAMGFYGEQSIQKEETLIEKQEETEESTKNRESTIPKENFDFIKKYISSNNTSTDVHVQTMDIENTKLIESFVSHCPCCNTLGSNNFCEITIPGFKKCLILSFVCPQCNFKSSEMKSSGETNSKGKILTLTVKKRSDLDRFVIKSETASVHIPLVDLTSDYGTLGGVLTTVEGLILKIVESLEDKFKFLLGDSSVSYTSQNVNSLENKENEININETKSLKEKVENLICTLKKMCTSQDMFPFDIIIDDVASNSFISTDENEQNENLKEEEYERTFEQNEILGLNQMKTEEY